MGIGFVAGVGVFRGFEEGKAGAGDTAGGLLAIEGGLGDAGGLTCFWDRAEAVRETGTDLGVSIGFNPPEKAAGDIGFGAFIAGFCFRGMAVTGDPVRRATNSGDF